jgi:hypothetical protein
MMKQSVKIWQYGVAFLLLIIVLVGLWRRNNGSYIDSIPAENYPAGANHANLPDTSEVRDLAKRPHKKF